jgi:hypothetical protein
MAAKPTASIPHHFPAIQAPELSGKRSINMKDIFLKNTKSIHPEGINIKR